VLSVAFPSRLEDFVTTMDWKHGSYIPFFDLISLARETGKLLMLPAVHFRYCLQFDIDSVLNGIIRPDDTLAALCSISARGLARLA